MATFKLSMVASLTMIALFLPGDFGSVIRVLFTALPKDCGDLNEPGFEGEGLSLEVGVDCNSTAFGVCFR